MKQIEKTSLSKYCNDKPNKFGCHEISNYALAQRNSRARKGKLGYHTKAKGTALSKEENSRKDQADLDFDDEYYEWFDNPEQALLAINSQSQESDISSESDEPEESSDDEQVLNISEEQPVDLTMQTTPAFRPYVKAILQLSDNKHIALTALIDTRVVSSIIHGSCLPRGYHVPTQVSFATANGEDLLLGTNLLSLITPFTFYPEGLSYTITNPNLSKLTSQVSRHLKKKSSLWSIEATNAVKELKQKRQSLPPLKILDNRHLISQIDASDHYWGTILIEESNGNRRIYGYKSGQFSEAQHHYPSSKKEVLAYGGSSLYRDSSSRQTTSKENPTQLQTSSQGQSWFFQIGSIILALHDVSDVFMEAAKAFKNSHSKNELGATKSKSLNATFLPPRHSQTLCLKPLFLPSFYRSQLSLPPYLISSCLVSLWPLIRSVSFTLFHSISLAFRSEWTLTPPSSLLPATTTVRSSSSSGGCTDILGRSNTPTFSYFKDWKFNYGADLKAKASLFLVNFVWFDSYPLWVFED
ncbi:hypothetical protein WN943_025320 [Citrus x changshan-huyou]